MGRYKAYVKRSFYSNIKSLDSFYICSNIHLNMFLDFFPPSITTLSDFFCGYASDCPVEQIIFDFEYDFECANMPLLLQNVTTCLRVSRRVCFKTF